MATVSFADNVLTKLADPVFSPTPTVRLYINVRLLVYSVPFIPIYASESERFVPDDIIVPTLYDIE